MDSDPIAPFPMYTDEYIVWIEKCKKEVLIKKDKKFLIIFITLFIIGCISFFCFLYLVSSLSFLVSFIIPFIFIGIPLILGLIMDKKLLTLI